MPQISPAQARLVDQVLTRVAQGFRAPNYVGSALFPVIPVTSRGGQVIQFGREEFFQYSNLARAPGQNTARIQVGYAGTPYTLVDYSLEVTYANETEQELERSPIGAVLDGRKLAIYKAMKALDLRLEIAQATLATTAANYQAANKVTKSGTGQWSDQTNNVSDPIADIETAKDAIGAATGEVANTVVMGRAVWQKLKTHPKIIDRLKYTQSDVPIEKAVADLFDVERVLVGRGIYSNDAGTTFTDIWGKFVVVAYTTPTPLQDMGSPTFGYTYNLDGYPFVEEPYPERASKSWVMPVTRSEAPYIVSANAGYLISAAVA